MKSFMNTFNTAKAAAAGDDLNLTLDDAFKLLEREQLENLTKELQGHFCTKVLPICAKMVHIEHGSLLDLPSDIMKKILVEMVALGEKEPYGVMGGTLVVNCVLETPANITKSTRIGRFPLKPELPSTFELHLTLFPSTQVKHRIANLMEKIQGKPCKLVIDQKFILTKKKLYR